MQLGRSHLEIGTTTARVSCQVQYAGEERTWWFSTALDDLGVLDSGPGAFVPSALLLASFLGENLTVEAPMSAVQLEGCRTAAQLFDRWWGWRPPVVTASVEQPRFAAGNDVGLLFTRGIDSLASLVASLDGAEPTITRLITIDGIEPSHSPVVAAAVWHDTQAMAHAVGLPIHRLTTNLRDETARHLTWEHAHGAVVLGAALLLGPLLGDIVISSSYALRHRHAFGSTFELDALWSTEHSAIHHLGEHLSRTEKARLIATRPQLASKVKVCWEGDQRGNCGACTKCLLAMTAFTVVDAQSILDVAFDRPLSVESIRRLRPMKIAHEVVEEIGDDHAELRDAWHDYLARSHNQQRRGLTGLDPASRFAAAGMVLGPQEAVGWGGDARPLHVRSDARHAICSATAGLDRPLRWCLVARTSAGAAQLSSVLTSHWGHGGVMLTDEVTPGPPPAAVALLLAHAAVSCWWADGDHLEGVPLVEAIEQGCIPVQVMPDDLAATLRDTLPPSAACLVLGLHEISHGYPGDDRLLERWSAARQLVVAGSLERDALVGANK